jgi:hypothetical protein
VKNKGWLLLLLGAGAAYFLYQKTAQAREQSSADQAAYFERLRRAAIRQRQVEALRNQAVITQGGTIAPPPAPVRISTPYSPESPMTGGMMPSSKFGPVMVP